jgi:cytosine/adenosine deaminase-related metal-dependent hydrolase/SAM-dependent methyltransferase
MATQTPSPGSVRRVSPAEGYRLWSRVYDTDPNPLLSLEQRYLESLLPSVENRDVFDLGCGTGRCLEWFAAQKPRTLLGVDLCPEMLQRARTKLGARAEFRIQDCDNDFELPQGSADLLLASFLLSYLEDLAKFASALRPILRPGGSLFVSDVHPETFAKLGWRRRFRLDGDSIEIATHDRPLREIVAVFQANGFAVTALVQPHFGEPELSGLPRGRKDSGREIAAHPAIYILELRVPEPPFTVQSSASATGQLSSLRFGRIALGPRESVQSSLFLQADRVAGIGTSPLPVLDEGGQNAVLDLHGLLAFPGLINSHDHLEFALFPRLGRGGYHNFMQWVEDIHAPDSSPVREHRCVPRDTRLRWGGLRNLLCGVTTVCHHNPYEPQVFENNFPVRVLRDFGWAHSLPLCVDIAEKKRATPEGQPFIIHLGEGVDADSAEDIFRLIREFPLDSDTVLVHCLGLDDAGRALLRRSDASVIWCSSSNVFLFGATLSRADLRDFPTVILGNDSPLTAEGDLLDEIRFARERTGVSPEDLYAMVTTKAAKVLRLREGQGTIRVASYADFFAVADRGLSPAATLSQISFRDVELVVLGGRVFLASPEMVKRMPRAVFQGLELLRVDGQLRWVRAGVSRLYADAECHLGDEIKMGGRRIECEFAD